MTSTVEQLRDDIDRGRGADKVSVSDPAAVPLGADDEAAGSPASSRRVKLARRTQSAGDFAARDADFGVALWCGLAGSWSFFFWVSVWLAR